MRFILRFADTAESCLDLCRVTLTNLKTKKQIDDYRSEKSAQIEAALAKLTNEKYRLFVEHYCRYLNKKNAAIFAGYSEKYAARSGFEIHSRDDVRAVMKEIFSIIAMLPEDNVAGIRRMAEINVSDYFKWQTYFVDKQTRVPIQQVIDETREEMEIQEDLLADYRDEPPKVQAAYLAQIGQLQRRINYLSKKLRRTPGGTMIITKTVEEKQKVLDLDKAVADGVPIKSVKHKETGIEVEFYSSADARNTIARIDGSFEEDNKQRQPINYTALSPERLKEISDKLDGSV